MTTTTLASPIAGLQPLSSVQSKLIRLGIQGPPGSGKTFAAATFPNTVYLDFDNKLRALKEFNPHLADKIQRVPFCDPTWVSQYNSSAYKSKGAMAPPNRRDALRHWLRTEAVKMSNDQTLVLDSFTSIQNAIDQQLDLEPVYAKGGGIDGFAFWKSKKAISVELMELLKGLNCAVVVTLHETIERDENGKSTGYLRPLMQGQFADELAGHFTDFYRQVFIPKLDNKGAVNVVNGKAAEADGWYWQVKSDHLFNACCSLIIKDPTIKYVKAQYDSLISQ